MMQSRVVHFIGIGGIGMSGIAKILLEQGFHVQGTDVKSSEITLSLGRLGAKIFIGHDARYLEGVDLVVYSSSIPASHPERVWAVKKKIRVIHRAQALADLCYGKYTIAVTGTHGKTTTTSMIGTILKEAGRDPSIVVGGCVKTFGGNASLGKGKEIVIEADESDSSFLKFSPDLEVVTNIEEEHMDHFPNIEAIESAYRNFINRLSRDGAWFGCLEDPGVLKLANEKVKSFYGYGFDPLKHAIAATGIVECPNGHRAVAFKVWYLGQELGSIEMKVIGRHNVLNALAATGVALKLGIAFAAVQQALSHYESAGRRFDVKYEDEQSLVVDDYAHHPTEIQKTLTAARGLHKKRIVAIFQPHRYSRVKALLSQFGNSFKNADKLIVTDIYAAGEALRANISGARVCQVIQSAGHPDAVFIERARVKEYVQSQIERGDLVITLGAGDIGQVAGQLAEFLKNQNSPGHKRPHPFWSVKGSVLLNEPLFKHTSLKVGGPVDFWAVPEDQEDLKTLLEICTENNLKTIIFGAGSNVLPPDEGLRGVAISLSSPYFRQLRFEDGKATARAGVLNSTFIQLAAEKGYGGYEFMAGIPGSVGGALAMNAGSHGQSIESLVESMTVMDFTGKLSILKKSRIPFNYRTSGIKNVMILEGVFLLPSSKREAVQKKLNEYRDYRQSSQDLRYPSAGCIFKNPENTRSSSGQLIEHAGLKGRRIGNAQVSLKHANFIVNLGGASSKDILDLIEEVKLVVKKRFELDLETEVKIL